MSMIFGVPVEIRQNENRVGALPFVVEELVKRGHQVYVESKAGVSSGYSDEEYEQAGALIVPSAEKLYAQADVILKVQSPNPVEYDLIRPEHTLFGFFNFLNNLDIARTLVGRGCT
ncbi:MAG: alanine dehydrogenase, partial [Calditrichaeota bacterium]